MARVLIVDDTDIVRKALELASANPPQLALVDYRMPGMDGITLFGALRDRLGDACPRIVFVSATSPDEVRAKTPPHLRPVGYVKKPFHLDELSYKVRDALAG